MNEKILIAEDDPVIRVQLKTLLSGNGYEVLAVTDFAKTAERVKAFFPPAGSLGHPAAGDGRL